MVVFREHLSRLEWAAATLILLGAVALRLESGSGRVDPIGVLYLAGACLCWALDNNLTQRLSLRDPVRVARFKTLSAGAANLTLGVLLGGAAPRPGLALALLAIGALSYGLSLVLDNYALRLLGAAREAALFSTAPFLGALASLVVLSERPTGWQLVGGAFMMAGVLTALRARHEHRHQHPPMEHEHTHTHDEHHPHMHEASAPSGQPHSHRHQHQALDHLHAHTSDLHHRHDH